MNQSTKSRGRTGPFLLAALCCMTLLPCCYTVRFINKVGTGEPEPLNQRNDPFTKGLRVVTLDTTLSLKPQLGHPLLLESCSSGGFYYFEYRVTFGGALLSAVTLGRKRQVRIKYVCLKEQ